MLEDYAMTPKAQRERTKSSVDSKIHTTTVRMPSELYEEVKALLDSGAFGSFNELLVASLKEYLKVIREKALDEQFARMAEDENYQRVALDLYNLFENSEQHARAAKATAAEGQWAENLNPVALLSTPRPTIKAGG
jgi:Arc/MetJ-type ribon-helix-helix transcriptional regulator